MRTDRSCWREDSDEECRLPPNDPNTHCASIEVNVSAETAFSFMADGMKQNYWALGSVNRRNLGNGLFVGTSSFDGSDLYVTLAGHPDLLMVDYCFGPTPETIAPVVEARIKPGVALGRKDNCCVVTLTIWRWPHSTDEEWELHYHLWKVEVHLIKGALERGL